MIHVDLLSITYQLPIQMVVINVTVMQWVQLDWIVTMVVSVLVRRL